MTVRLTKPAEAQLKEIRRWTVGHWGARQADAFLQGLADSIKRLEDQPGMGRKRPAIGPNVRSIRYRSYAIFYAETEAGPVVAAVVHEKRDNNAEKIGRYFRNL